MVKRLFGITGLLLGLGFVLAQQPSAKQVPLQRPTIAVAEFKANGVPQTVTRQLRSAMEDVLLSSKRYRVLTRELDNALKERALAQAGVTAQNAQDAGKLVNAEFIVFGEVDLEGGEYSIEAKIMQVSSGDLVHSFPKTVERTDIPQFAAEFMQALWVRQPLQVSILNWADGTATVGAGAEQGLREGQDGSLWRVIAGGDQRRVGSLEVLNVGIKTSDIKYTLNSGLQLKSSDKLIADIGYFQRLDQDSQSIWYKAAPTVFEVRVLNASTGKRFENRSQVRLGEKVQVRFKVPVAGYVYLVSVFPGDQQFNLVYSSPNPLSSGQEVAFPKATDPFELVAQPPVGLSLLKVYILPKPIAELNNASGLGTREIAALQKTIEEAGRNWASGELLLEITK